MQDVMGMSQDSEDPPAVGCSAENVIDARTRKPDRNRGGTLGSLTEE